MSDWCRTYLGCAQKSVWITDFCLAKSVFDLSISTAHFMFSSHIGGSTVDYLAPENLNNKLIQQHGWSRRKAEESPGFIGQDAG